MPVMDVELHSGAAVAEWRSVMTTEMNVGNGRVLWLRCFDKVIHFVPRVHRCVRLRKGEHRGAKQAGTR